MGKQNRYIIRDREQSAIAESFRALSAALQENQAENGAKTILFSTVTNGESDSMTAVNTAATLAGKEDDRQVNIGFNYGLNPRVVLKADLQDSNQPGGLGDGLNLGVGLSF